jgi:hypothetical protein
MSFSSFYGAQRARISHAVRWVTNRFARPDVLLLGEYHGANLGDHLLGQAISRELRTLGYSPALLTLHNLRIEPVFAGVPIVIGGGNVLDDRSVQRVSSYWARAGRAPICGVGLDYVSAKVFDTHKDFFGQFSSLYFRSVAQAKQAQEMFGPVDRTKFGFTPDMVWLMGNSLRAMGEHYDSQSPLVGINITPLFVKIRRGFRSELAISENDAFFSQAKSESEAYKRLVCFAVERCLSMGHRVVHLPFDVGDDLIAREWLQPLGVRCEPYSADIQKVMRKMAACRYFIPTRFHALLCAMAAGIPSKPIPYAEKNADLLRQFGFSYWAEQVPVRFCNNDSAIRDLLCGDEVVLPKAQEVRGAIRLAQDALRGTLEDLLAN